MNFINNSIFKLLLFATQHYLYYEICYHHDESSDEILDFNFLSQHVH
ncbi:hypothetical protein [Clostridioides difficile]|nr:hypothetical protein [Clostridioides difficile]